MNVPTGGPVRDDAGEGKLKRSLNTTQIVLYGLGVTVGAGIYVLIGEAAGKAGIYTPFAFVLAAIVMAFSAASFAELCTRYPVSAGEAAYVEAGFRSGSLAVFIGLCVILVGVSSAATVAVGVTGYVQAFVDLDARVIASAIIVVLGLVAVWGVTESVTLAAVFALIEIGGLLAIIFAGFWQDPDLLSSAPALVPSTADYKIWSGVFAAALLAFFAFIGFEDMVNVAEEVKSPKRTMPIAIFLTLVISAAIYFLVAIIAVRSGPIDELAASAAPLAVVVERLDVLSPSALSAIAIIAGLNGIIVQMIMAARVLYGLAHKGYLPAIFANIHPLTRTPHIATFLVLLIILGLGLTFPVGTLAEFTSGITLGIFAFVNMALLLLKLRDEETVPDGITVWPIVPAIGALLCVSVLILYLFQ